MSGGYTQAVESITETAPEDIQREKHPNFVDTFGRVQLKYGDMSYVCGCAVTGSQVTCVEHHHIRPALSAQPCGCDLGASHICEWHASHGLSLPKRAVPVVTQHERQQQELNRLLAQGQAQSIPSPDTFVDVARLQEKNLKTAIRSTGGAPILPTAPTARKQTPIYSGVLKYFPKALAEVARVSYAGNEQHNPGQPLHWAREKSTDQHDCIVRHLLEAGTRDTDGMLHSAKVCWRSLAALELELEALEREGR